MFNNNTAKISSRLVARTRHMLTQCQHSFNNERTVSNSIRTTTCLFSNPFGYCFFRRVPAGQPHRASIPFISRRQPFIKSLWSLGFVSIFVNSDHYESKNEAKSGSRRRYEYVWTKRCTELEDYKEIHDDCLVPRKYAANPQLGNWVDKQRQEYRKLKKGKRSMMTPGRIQKLEELGFVWNPLEDLWTLRYAELEEYKATHGNCTVPKKYATNPQLGRWVDNQRQNYRIFKEGKPSAMTPARIQKLEELGFVWSPFEDVWTQRYAELEEYKATHGNCLVPKKYATNPQLGNWVDTQRQNYRIFKDGKASAITPDRIRELDELNFVWNSHDATWLEAYEKLKLYKHGTVPAPKEDESLYNWVLKQQIQYHNEDPKLTKERIEMLNALDFPWNGGDHAVEQQDGWGDPAITRQACEKSFLRVIGLNINSFKTNQPLRDMVKTYDPDILCLAEVNIAWHKLPIGEAKKLIRKWWPRAFDVFSWYKDDQNVRKTYQAGGVAIVVSAGQVQNVVDSGEDPLGLGRWVWVRLKLGNGSHLCILSAYRPIRSTEQKAYSTFNQQLSYFKKTPEEVDCCPINEFQQGLIKDISTFCRKGDRICLFVDANEDVRREDEKSFSKALASVHLDEITVRLHGSNSRRKTHKSGSVPIDGIFMDSKSQALRTGYLPFVPRLSDHCPLFVDIDFE